MSPQKLSDFSDAQLPDPFDEKLPDAPVDLDDLDGFIDVAIDALKGSKDADLKLIDQPFTHTCEDVLHSIFVQRDFMDLPPYTLGETFTLIYSLYKVFREHRTQRRANIVDSTFDGHLIPALLIMIRKLKITDLATLLACIFHDMPEDPKVPVPSPDYFDDNYNPLPRAILKEVCLQAETRVFGVTKPDEAELPLIGEPNFGRKGEALLRLCTTTLHEKGGLATILIKLADRLNNHETLNSKPPYKRRKISQETVDIYIPFAQAIQSYPTADELMQFCLPHLNPTFYQQFYFNGWEPSMNNGSDYASLGQTARYHQFRTRHFTPEDPAGTPLPGGIKTTLENLLSMNLGVISDPIRLAPLSVNNYFVPDVPLNQQRFNDLSISPYDPMCEIKILIEDGAPVDEIIDTLIEQYGSTPGNSIEIQPLFAQNLGTRVTIFDAQHQAFLPFRIHDWEKEYAHHNSPFLNQPLPQKLSATIQSIIDRSENARQAQDLGFDPVQFTKSALRKISNVPE